MTEHDLYRFFPSLLDRAGELPDSLRPHLEELLAWDRDGRRWENLRALFTLEPGLAYLNTATLGACPRLVVEAHIAFLRRMESNPVRQEYVEMLPAMEAARAEAAALLGARPDEVAFTSCATDGLDMVAAGVDLRPGDEVLTTTREHPGGMAGWRNLAVRRGIALREAELPLTPAGPAEIVDALRAGVGDRTRALCISHVNTITGLRMPIAEAAHLAREHGLLLIVDGAQAVGTVPADLNRSGADAYASSSHKWLLGPKGCGLLYVRRGSQEKIRPTFLQDGSDAYTPSTGTRNAPQILSHGAAIGFHRFLGPQAVEARGLDLARFFRGRIAEIPELRLVSPTDPALDSAITTFTLPRGAAETIVERLERENRIAVKAVPRPHFDGRGIRVSAHVYNTEDELERLAAALAALAG